MPENRAEPVVGDVIEVGTPQGLAYAQYSHNSERLGPLLRVLPGLYRLRPDDLTRIVALPERFFTFFPVVAAVSQGLVHIVGHQPVPDRARSFPLMRMAGSRDKSGRVLDWWLYDGNREWRIGQLSAGQEQLSIAAIWNDTLLVDRILSGWAPGQARDIGGSAPTAAARRAENPDTAAIQELEKAGSRTDAVHEIRHYLYFPKENSAKTAAQHLAKLGLEATIKRRHDQWAVIGRHKMIPSTDNIESFRNKLEKLAEASGGEYDGWEAAVTRPSV